MKVLSATRSRAAERRFEAYDFGWDVVEVHHWHCGGEADEFCRTIIFHGVEPQAGTVRGHFYVRFKPGVAVVVESYAMVEDCLVGRAPT